MITYQQFTKPQIQPFMLTINTLKPTGTTLEKEWLLSFIETRHIPAIQQITDIFTKFLSRALFERLRDKLGVGLPTISSLYFIVNYSFTSSKHRIYQYKVLTSIHKLKINILNLFTNLRSKF